MWSEAQSKLDVKFVVFLLACLVLGVPVVIGLVTQGLLIRIAQWADR